MDTTNPLIFPKGKPMELFIANTDSLVERIQSALPDTHVVKALNTVNNYLMTHPVDLSSPDHILEIDLREGIPALPTRFSGPAQVLQSTDSKLHKDRIVVHRKNAPPGQLPGNERRSGM